MSLEQFGFVQPLVVDENEEIIIGHTRLAGAKKLGLKTVPVLVKAGLSDEQKKTLRILDNRSHQATWDAELLKNELDFLLNADFDLSLTGFDESELQSFMADLQDIEPDTPEPPADEPAPRKPSIKFTEEQMEVVLQAIYKIREAENDKNISDGRAIEIDIRLDQASVDHAHDKTCIRVCGFRN